MKQRQAQEDRARKQRELDDATRASAAAKKATGGGTDLVKERQRKAQEEKEKKMQQYSELAKTSSQAYQAGARARRNTAMLSCGHCKSAENDAICRLFHFDNLCFVLTAIFPSKTS